MTSSLPKDHREAIARAIEMAENAAASAASVVDDTATAVAKAAQAAASAAGLAAVGASGAAVGGDREAAIAADKAGGTSSAARAAIAAYACAFVTHANEAATAVAAGESAALAVECTASAVADLIRENDIRELIAADFQRVSDGASAGAWHASTPVSPEVFGPLWPEGEPDWEAVKSPAPTAANERAEPSFDLWIEPGNASTETIQEVLVALSRLHMAAGGPGLEFSPDGDFVCIREMVSA